MQTKTTFNPEISEYLELNGFRQIDAKMLHDGMVWRTDFLAIQFWQNRIEKHVCTPHGDFKLDNTYIGFDGQNIQHLIMILHCMGAITIESANKMADEQESQVKHISKILLSMPVSSNPQTRED